MKIHPFIPRFIKWAQKQLNGNQEEKLRVVVQTIQNIKKIVDSNVVASIVKIIPGDTDDKIRLAISVALAKVLYFGIPSKATKEQPELLVRDAVKHLKPKSKEGRRFHYQSWAGRLMADVGKLDEVVARDLVEKYYQDHKEELNATA